MRFSQDPVVRCFLAKRSSLGAWARENTCWEAIALAAGVDPLRLLGAALVIWREHTLMVGELIALSHSPEVVKSDWSTLNSPADGAIAISFIS